MKMKEFDLEYDHYLFTRDERGKLKKQLLKNIRVIVGFSNEIKEERIHNINELKKRIYLKTKEFMGEHGSHVAGIAPTSVSRYIKIPKEG